MTEKASEFAAELEDNIDKSERNDGGNSTKGDEIGLTVGSGGLQGVIRAGIITNFAATIGFWVAFVAFGTGLASFVAAVRFTTSGERVAILPCWAGLDGGIEIGGFDTIAGGLVDDFTIGTGAEFLVVVGFAWGGMIGLKPLF